MQTDDVKFNARERGGDKLRAFAFRLTDGRYAAIVEGSDDSAAPRYYPQIAELKQQFALIVPDARIPVYASHEIGDVFRHLASRSAGTPA